MSGQDRPVASHVPWGFLLALVGFVLPTFAFTSCGESVADVSAFQAAVGDVIEVEDQYLDDFAESRTDSGRVDLPVDVVAILLGLLVIASAVRWWMRSRPLESSLMALAAMAMAVVALPASLGRSLDPAGEVEVGIGGGGFVLLLGLWSSVALASTTALTPPFPRPYVIMNGVLAAILVIAGLSAAGAEPDAFFGSPWNVTAVLIVLAAILDLIVIGLIRLWRWRRLARTTRSPGDSTTS